MLNIKDIDNLINVLTEVKKEQKSKQLDMLQEKIKQELINELESTLIHFQSNTMEKFLEDSDKHICFDYNFDVIMNDIKDKLVICVWEVE
jgi:hypothetical protein